MNIQPRHSMRPPNFLIPATVLVTTLLTACGGGGGGGGATAIPEPVKTLASLVAKDVPAEWPGNFKAVIVKRTDLATDADLAMTTNKPGAIFIQIWYLDQDQQRQPVAFLTLDALARAGGSLTIPNVPRAVKVLKSEVYTASGTSQQTLARKEITV